MTTLVYFFKYAEGADDAWYTSDRLLRELEVRGVTGVRSWRTLYAEREATPMRPMNDYDRMTEVRFADLSACEAALCSNESLWHGSRRKGMERWLGTVVPDEPEFDLLRDTPFQHYRYLSLPIEWRTGREPLAPEPSGTSMAKYMYFFGYRPEADIRDSEDWYLGHHTREGKQLPGLMRYVTYRHVPMPRLASFIPEAAIFYRFTELCFETIELQQRICDAEGPRWTPSNRYGPVCWDWEKYKCFYISNVPDIDLARAESTR